MLFYSVRYIENSTDDCVQQLEDKIVTKLHDRVTALKKSREWERSYMRFEELLQDAKKEEQSRVQKLISMMTEAGETDKLAKLADTVFLQEMYEKYHL